MARSPQSLRGRQLAAAVDAINEMVAEELIRESVITSAGAVIEHMSGEGRRILFNQYSISATQMVASAFGRGLQNMSNDAANTLLKAFNAIQQASVGDPTRDNAEVTAAMQLFADKINEEILEAYLREFGGRSYRQGDESRRSGGIENFLRKGKMAQADGHKLTISWAPAVNDDDVPHIFRLNYGTKAHSQAAGGAKQGRRPPIFRIRMVPGAPSVAKELRGERRKAFTYPGGQFPFRLNMGSAGQVQLFYADGRNTLRGPMPSRGIAPSYFVEYGITAAGNILPREFDQMIKRWQRRVARQFK